MLSSDEIVQQIGERTKSTALDVALVSRSRGRWKEEHHLIYRYCRWNPDKIKANMKHFMRQTVWGTNEYDEGSETMISDTIAI